MQLLSALVQRCRPLFNARAVFPLSQQETFFKHTDGRWLYNEMQQNACRYVKFDISELQRVACAAVGAQSRVEFTKLAEGSYNKAFNLRFDNGAEVIAKIPCKVAGEVVTMEFVRDVLDILAPRVHAWSAHADRSPVGAEYIIMEKMPGVDLYHRWFQIAKLEVSALVDDMLRMENAFEDVPFSQIGSGYYKEDVSAELQSRPLFLPDGLPEDKPALLDKLKAASTKYRIGPIADRQWWRAERVGILSTVVHVGSTMSDFLLAAAKVERTWIAQHAAHNAASHLRRFPFHDPETHLKVLDMYSKAVPQIVRPNHLCTPTIWHPDISLRNIRVSATGHANIVDVIDCQHANIAPYCMQAHFPAMFQYDGGLIDVPIGVRVPQLPDHLSSLSAEEQQAYAVHLKIAFRQKHYEFKIRRNTRRFEAWSAAFGAGLPMMPYRAPRIWSDSIIPLRQTLMDLRNVWKDVAAEGQPCPISFTDNEIAAQEIEHERYTKYEQSVDSLNTDLGCSGDGLVSHEAYEESMELLKARRDAWDEQTCGGPFPYANGSFSFLS